MHNKRTRREVLGWGLAGSLAACSPQKAATTAPAPTGTALPGATPNSGASPTSDRRALQATDLPNYVPSSHFPEGILSGDPLPTSVVLWTRPSAALVTTGAPLIAELARDAGFQSIDATATMTPDPGIGGSSKFVVEGLAPNTSYAYRFRIGEQTSPIGLTRTAPQPDDLVDELTVAVFSCQRWTHGYFTAHADMATQAPDLVLCLGDYVYNTGAADGVTVPGRTDPIQDATSLDDFRGKYEHYRTDTNLQAMHARCPMIAIPDNHDGAPLPDDSMYPGAHQAFFEKMPVRTTPGDPMGTHRRFTWGRLVDVWMLDLQRFATPGKRGSGNTDGDLDMMDPKVTYLGEEQRRWLFDGLADTKAVWQVIGSTKQFSPLRIRAGDGSKALNDGTYVNLDQWDGYQAERLRLLDEVARLGRTGTVAVSGDMHWFWAADVPRNIDDPASPAIMTDFLCGGISSSNADERIGGGTAGPQTKTLLGAFAPANPHARYFDGDRHGYGLFRFRADGAEVEYRSPVTIREPTSTTEVVAKFRLDPNKPGMTLVEAVGWDPATGRPTP